LYNQNVKYILHFFKKSAMTDVNEIVTLRRALQIDYNLPIRTEYADYIVRLITEAENEDK